MTPPAAKAAPAAKRGRPPRLSRDAILDAALHLLERHPDEPLTLSRVAEAVDAVPAALYRHVGSHDALIDGVLGRVLDGISFEVRTRASWKNQVRDWMTCVRDQMLRYPAVVTLIGRSGRTSPAWLEATAPLVEILERAGLRGAALAHSYLWVTESTMGCVVNEAALPYPEQIAGAASARDEMSEETRKRLDSLGRHLTALDSESFFALIVDRTIAAIPEPPATSTKRRG